MAIGAGSVHRRRYSVAIDVGGIPVAIDAGSIPMATIASGISLAIDPATSSSGAGRAACGILNFA